jgi:SAM-dependent methyltransferase
MDDLLRATATAEARHFWFRGFRAFVTPLLARVSRQRTGSGVARVLDCGCGTGANLALLNRFGRAYGFDLSAHGLKFARQAGRTLVARASATAAPFPAGAFDIVTSFDVLYALDDRSEREAIQEMYRLLKPGGFAVINVAAMDVLRGDHSVLSHEVRRYSRAGLRARLTEAGFSIERITYTNFLLFPMMAVARTLQRRRGLKGEAEAQGEIRIPPAPVNGALTALLLLESLWLRWFDAPAGSSLLCLARKPTLNAQGSTLRAPET